MINVIALARQVKLENEKISDSGSQADIKCDFTAIEAAVRLKETTDCKVSAIIMGYEKTALSQARDAIAMGCDFARAICVRELDKLDAWGCARAFIQAVGDEKYDLIISGGFPVDADTVSIGLLTAAMAELPFVTGVDKISVSENFIVADRKTEGKIQRLKVALPCLVSALPPPEAPVYKTVSGINKAYSQEMAEEKLDFSWYENKTAVCAGLKLEARKRGSMLTAVSTEEAVTAMLERITTAHLL